KFAVPAWPVWTDGEHQTILCLPPVRNAGRRNDDAAWYWLQTGLPGFREPFPESAPLARGRAGFYKLWPGRLEDRIDLPPERSARLSGDSDFSSRTPALHTFERYSGSPFPGRPPEYLHETMS